MKLTAGSDVHPSSQNISTYKCRRIDSDRVGETTWSCRRNDLDVGESTCRRNDWHPPPDDYPGPRGFLLFFIGKFCDANRFLNFFYWHERKLFLPTRRFDQRFDQRFAPQISKWKKVILKESLWDQGTRWWAPKAPKPFVNLEYVWTWECVQLMITNKVGSEHNLVKANLRDL